MYSIWKSENGNDYERMPYVVFKGNREAKRFLRELENAAKLYLGLHDIRYSFEIRREVAN